MKRVYLVTFLTCLILFLGFFIAFKVINPYQERDSLKIGFVYDNDESTPYTYNFSLAKDALEKKYGERVEIVSCSNVLDDEMEEPLRELADGGATLSFLTVTANW